MYRLLEEDWVKWHKRHPVVLSIVAGTRGYFEADGGFTGEVNGVGF
jgi:hypothetical protein